MLFGLLCEIVPAKFLVLSGVAGQIGTLIILVTTSSFPWMIVQEVTEGSGSAAQLLFFAYVFQLVPRDEYQKIASYVASSSLFSNVLSPLIGQLAVIFLPLSSLMYISLGLAALNLLVGLFLPTGRPTTPPPPRLSPPPSPPSRGAPLPIPTSIPTALSTSTFNTPPEDVTPGDFHIPLGDTGPLHQPPLVKKGFSLRVRLWALGREVWLTYSQPAIDPVHNYNGYFIAGAYLLASLCALIPARIDAWLCRHHSALLVLLPLAAGSLLICLALLARSLPLGYILFAAYHCIFETAIPIGRAVIARSMPGARFLLIFAINHSITLIFESLLQLVLHLVSAQSRTNFLVFGIVFVCLAGVTLAFLCARLACLRRCKAAAGAEQQEEEQGLMGRRKVVVPWRCPCGCVPPTCVPPAGVMPDVVQVVTPTLLPGTADVAGVDEAA
ncbi:reduced folate carrier [Paratrimastix pyriformis]|uniref:Reduced folate carrier n=1 Tax=Paratrimastix pyriformis TaxID=342808 RepID=A0ABQ8UQX4_9EUKA|nr:reduced folate carrier [Paratrimastix pyriformis]